MSDTADTALLMTLMSHGYEYDSTIGSGGFAFVCKVWSQKYQEHFAAKIYPLSSTRNLPTFTREVKALVDLCNPNILRIYDHFHDSHYLIIILEYCPNGSLMDLLEDGKPLPLRQFLAIANEITQAILSSHGSSIAHRDIKPPNILFDKYGHTKLADFGLAQRLGEGGSSRRFGGTLCFIAPELFERSMVNAFKADVWALGVTFFMMITGKIPWSGRDEAAIRDNIQKGEFEIPDYVDSKIASVIAAAMQTDPEKRPSMEEIMKMPMFDYDATFTQEFSLRHFTLQSAISGGVFKPKIQGGFNSGVMAQRRRTFVVVKRISQKSRSNGVIGPRRISLALPKLPEMVRSSASDGVA